MDKKSNRFPRMTAEPVPPHYKTPEAQGMSHPS